MTAAAKVLRGAAAISEMLDLIGEQDEGQTDKRVAEVLVEHELDIRDMLAFTLKKISNRCKP